MSETWAAGEALATMDRALRFEASLRTRTEGLTWIVWGLVTAAIFLSYEAVGPLYYGRDAPFASSPIPEEQRSPWWVGGLWVPWIAIGAATTYALWRSAALAAPTAAAAAAARRNSLAWGAGYVVFLFLGWGVAVLALPERAESVYPLLGIGTAWILLGAFNVARATPTGRKVSVAIGVAIYLVGLGAAWAYGDPHDDASGLPGLTAAAVTLLAPLAGGLWETMRG